MQAAFVAQKALAIAQILMYTHLAAAQVMAIPGDVTKVMGFSLSSLIMAQGYASAGLMGAMAIGQVAGGGGGGSTYAGAYDKGGVIPYGQYGIVGEYGPEIVQGPAHVTGREATARKLGGGGSEYNITLSPQITVTTQGSDSGGTDKENAKQVAEMVRGVVMSTLTEQTRPNGALDTWIRNQRK